MKQVTDFAPLKDNSISLSSRAPATADKMLLLCPTALQELAAAAVSSQWEFLHCKLFLTVFFKAQPFPEIILPKLTKLWAFSQKYSLYSGHRGPCIYYYAVINRWIKTRICFLPLKAADTSKNPGENAVLTNTSAKWMVFSLILSTWWMTCWITSEVNFFCCLGVFSFNQL